MITSINASNFEPSRLGTCQHSKRSFVLSRPDVTFLPESKHIVNDGVNIPVKKNIIGQSKEVKTIIRLRLMTVGTTFPTKPPQIYLEEGLVSPH